MFSTSTQSASKKLSVVVVIWKQKYEMKSFEKSGSLKTKNKKIRKREKLRDVRQNFGIWKGFQVWRDFHHTKTV